MDQAKTPTEKPTLEVFVELERVSDNRMMYRLNHMLGLISSRAVEDPEFLSSFLAFLDAANLLDPAFDCGNWDVLPYEIELVHPVVPMPSPWRC